MKHSRSIVCIEHIENDLLIIDSGEHYPVQQRCRIKDEGTGFYSVYGLQATKDDDICSHVELACGRCRYVNQTRRAPATGSEGLSSYYVCCAARVSGSMGLVRPGLDQDWTKTGRKEELLWYLSSARPVTDSHPIVS